MLQYCLAVYYGSVNYCEDVAISSRKCSTWRQSNVYDLWCMLIVASSKDD